MTKVYHIDPKVDIEASILWQYAEAKSLASIIKKEQAFYDTNVSEFIEFWREKMLSIDTADDFALSVWGKILNFNRQILLEDGSIYVLSTEGYRLLLKGQFLKLTTIGTIPEANRYLNLLFANQGLSYCLDNYNMTISYIFEFLPNEEQLFILKNIDFLPRPAGVKYEILILNDQFLGFDGSDMQTFNHGVLYNRKSLR